MELRTVASTWYEVVFARSYGAKLDNTFYSKREAQKAIKEYKERQVQRGNKPSECFILLCNVVRMMDDNGDTVSETVTKVRV